jgi:periplasmic divalent cation tolerance protein
MRTLPDHDSSARIVFTTTATVEEAESLARALVEERLAACVSLIPSVRSIFRWQGKVGDAAETLLVIKTNAEKLADLEARIHALHSYETPEFLVLAVESGSAAYLDWLMASLSKP